MSAMPLRWHSSWLLSHKIWNTWSQWDFGRTAPGYSGHRCHCWRDSLFCRCYFELFAISSIHFFQTCTTFLWQVNQTADKIWLQVIFPTPLEPVSGLGRLRTGKACLRPGVRNRVWSPDKKERAESMENPKAEHGQNLKFSELQTLDPFFQKFWQGPNLLGRGSEKHKNACWADICSISGS